MQNFHFFRGFRVAELASGENGMALNHPAYLMPGNRSESFGWITERRHYNARHIFHRRVWYRALSALCACSKFRIILNA